MKKITVIVAALVLAKLSLLAAPLPAPKRSIATTLTIAWDNPTNWTDGTSIPAGTPGYTKIYKLTGNLDGDQLTNAAWQYVTMTDWPATSCTISVTETVYRITAVAGAWTPVGTNESAYAAPLVWTNAPLVPNVVRFK